MSQQTVDQYQVYREKIMSSCFRHTKFEMPLRCLSNFTQAVGYTILEFRGEVLARESNKYVTVSADGNPCDYRGERGQGLRSGCSCTPTAFKFSLGFMKLLEWRLAPKLGFQNINLLKTLRCNTQISGFSPTFLLGPIFRTEVCFMSIGCILFSF